MRLLLYLPSIRSIGDLAGDLVRRLLGHQDLLRRAGHGWRRAGTLRGQQPLLRLHLRSLRQQSMRRLLLLLTQPLELQLLLFRITLHRRHTLSRLLLHTPL